MATMLKRAAALAVAGACVALMAGQAAAQTTKLALGMSDWTGYAPLSLADKAGIFKKNGLEVDLKMIPQKDRNLALASKSIQCIATIVPTHMTWSAGGVPIVQIFAMDKSNGADGLVVRNNINSFADLKGKTVAVSVPGTTPYFGLAWMLEKNGMNIKKDVKIATLEPGPAAQAFMAGRNDAAFVYEPYLSAIRKDTKSGKILVTTRDYPMIIDTVGCAPDWLKNNQKAAKALTESYFEALDLIKADPVKSNEIMGAVVKQSGKEFAESASYLQWLGREENKVFFEKELLPFMKQSAAILKDIGVIRKEPADYSTLYDASFVR